MDEPLYKDREWLYQKIVVEKLKDKDVAKMFDVTRKNISYWRKKFDIEYPLEKHEDRKWMYRKLVAEKLSIKEVAKQAQVTEQTIRNRANRLKLDYRERKKPLSETHPRAIFGVAHREKRQDRTVHG